MNLPYAWLKLETGITMRQTSERPEVQASWAHWDFIELNICFGGEIEEEEELVTQSTTVRSKDEQ